MTRRALIDCTLGPLQRHAARLLWAGRRESTKVSYSGKWRRFVDFCTITLPSEYGMHPRQALPASMSTVLLYLSHLSQEGETLKERRSPRIVLVQYFGDTLPTSTPTTRCADYCGVGMIHLLLGNIQTRCIGHCQTKNHYVPPWSESGSRYYCAVHLIQLQPGALGWVIVCGLAQRVPLWRSELLVCRLCTTACGSH